MCALGPSNELIQVFQGEGEIESCVCVNTSQPSLRKDSGFGRVVKIEGLAALR